MRLVGENKMLVNKEAVMNKMALVICLFYSFCYVNCGYAIGDCDCTAILEYGVRNRLRLHNVESLHNTLQQISDNHKSTTRSGSSNFAINAIYEGVPIGLKNTSDDFFQNIATNYTEMLHNISSYKEIAIESDIVDSRVYDSLDRCIEKCGQIYKLSWQFKRITEDRYGLTVSQSRDLLVPITVVGRSVDQFLIDDSDTEILVEGTKLDPGETYTISLSRPDPYVESVFFLQFSNFIPEIEIRLPPKTNSIHGGYTTFSHIPHGAGDCADLHSHTWSSIPKEYNGKPWNKWKLFISMKSDIKDLKIYNPEQGPARRYVQSDQLVTNLASLATRSDAENHAFSNDGGKLAVYFKDTSQLSKFTFSIKHWSQTGIQDEYGLENKDFDVLYWWDVWK